MWVATLSSYQCVLTFILVLLLAQVSSVQWSLSRQEQLVLSSSWDHTIRSVSDLPHWLLFSSLSLSLSAYFQSGTLRHASVWLCSLITQLWCMVWVGLLHCQEYSPLFQVTKGRSDKEREGERETVCVVCIVGDGFLRVWDHATPTRCTAHSSSGSGELLCCSWNKYQQYSVCTGGVDSTLRYEESKKESAGRRRDCLLLNRVWDIRQLSLPVCVMHGHTQAVRRVCYDPHTPTLLASSSYDCTVRWVYIIQKLFVWGKFKSMSVWVVAL